MKISKIREVLTNIVVSEREKLAEPLHTKEELDEISSELCSISNLIDNYRSLISNKISQGVLKASTPKVAPITMKEVYDE
jgi:hypothetical protein